MYGCSLGNYVYLLVFATLKNFINLKSYSKPFFQDGLFLSLLLFACMFVTEVTPTRINANLCWTQP